MALAPVIRAQSLTCQTAVLPLRVQDGIVGIFGCLSVRGGTGSIGFNVRQVPIIDIVSVSCGPIEVCFTMSQPGMMNIIGPITLRGDMTQFVAAGLGAFVKFWGGKYTLRNPST